MNSELMALADRCEAATGPDRELDALIAATLRIGTEYSWAWNFPTWIGHRDGRVELGKNGPSFTSPKYTASLDAAMALVPDGCNFSVDRIGAQFGAVVNRSPLSTNAAVADNCTTAARALTAACLRAIASQEKPA